jgi:hypothetical protein
MSKMRKRDEIIVDTADNENLHMIRAGLYFFAE